MATTHAGAHRRTRGSAIQADRDAESAVWRTAERRSDLTRLGLAVALLLVSLLAIQRTHLSLIERDIFRLFNDLPPGLTGPAWLVMHFGDMLAPVVIGLGVLVLTRSTRLAVSVVAAGAGAWMLAQGLKMLVERARPADFLDGLQREWSSGGPGFVSGHTAVATAMAAVLAPALPRRWRRVVWGIAALVGISRIYVGVHLPLDVVGGAAIGWFTGTLVYMLVGTPRPQRTPASVAEMLNRLGLEVESVEPAQVYAKVSVPFRVTTKDGRRLFAKVLDQNPRSTDWVLRLARVLATRERRDISAIASLPVAADHEAAVTLVAERAGVRVPPVVLARGDGAAAVVVQQEVPGQDLSAVPSEVITDQVLAEVWEQVRLLRRAHIAHRDLVRGNILLDTSGHPWLVDFRDAEVGAPEDSQDNDVAELVASLAVVVGPERAVASALAGLGPDALEQALPALQPFALSPRTRVELRAQPTLLDAVRDAAGGGPEASSQLHLGSRLWLPGLTAAAGYVVLVLVAGAGPVRDTFSALNVRWLGIALVGYAAAVLLLGYALVLATRRRIAVGRSAAAANVGITAEVIGGPAARRHYLVTYVRSCGGRGKDAHSAADLLMTGELAAAVVVAFGAGALDWWRDGIQVRMTTTAALFLAVAVVAALMAIVERHRLRANWPPFSRRRSIAAALEAARRGRGQATAVLAAVLGVEIGLVMALDSTLRGVPGPGRSLAFVALALSGTRVVMALVGVPSAPVVMEATCAAFLVALGLTPAHAVMAVLMYAFIRYWVTGVASAFAGPRLAPVHVPETAGGTPSPAGGTPSLAGDRAR